MTIRPTVSFRIGISTRQTSLATRITEMGQNMDQGQKHPPLPADNPAWDWDAQSFVPDFGWYGEHSWTDVRMRVVGHMAMAYRDLEESTFYKRTGTLAILVYQEMIQTLQAIDTASSKFADEIRMVLLKSAERDVQILRALHTKAVLPRGLSRFFDALAD